MSRSIKIYMDGADINDIRELLANPSISGITTNPTLMHGSGVQNYREFGQQVAELAGETPVSFEVLSTEPSQLINEAAEIASWGSNVWVKIPIVDGRGESLLPSIVNAQQQKIKVNVTAVFTFQQLISLAETLDKSMPAIVSIFAGRIADAGVDPRETFEFASEVFASHVAVQLLWASTRQLFSVIEAEKSGAHIITVQPQLLAKLDLIGKDLDQYSIETVQMFENDAVSSGLTL